MALRINTRIPNARDDRPRAGTQLRQLRDSDEEMRGEQLVLAAQQRRQPVGDDEAFKVDARHLRFQHPHDRHRAPICSAAPRMRSTQLAHGKDPARRSAARIPSPTVNVTMAFPQ